MKLIQPAIILILFLLLIFGWMHYSNKESKTSVANLKEKLDSAIRPHEQAIKKLEIYRSRTIRKIRTDSVKSYQAAQIFRKEISGLRKQLKEVKYTGNPSTVPDDSVKIAMQALKEAPIKDSIISVQEKENVRLNSQVETMRVDYNALTGNLISQIDQQKKISEDYKAFGEAMVKENKKIRHKGIWQSVKIGAVALGVGFVIGLSR